MPGGKSFPLSLVIRAVDQATAPLRKVSAALGDISKQAGAMGRTLTMGVTAPLAGLATAGVVAFGRFEAGMSNVSTLVDTSVESMDAMGAEVLALGRRTPVALADLTSALYDVRSAGVTAAEQFRVLEGSGRLAVAGLGSTKEAVDLVTSSINAFGLQGEEQARVYDLIFKTVKTGKTNISQLAQGFGGVAGTVASAGVKLDEYLASVAAMTTTGVPASEAHTQLKAVISGLTGETKEAEAIFKRLGAKSFKELIASSGGLVPALEKIKGVVGDNDKVLLKAVGGAEAFNAVLSLTGKQREAFITTLLDMRNGANAVDAAFEKQSRTGAATMQRMQNLLEGVAISIGRTLVPVLEQLAPLLERAADWWSSLSDEGQRSIIVMGGVAAATGPTMKAVVGLTSAVSWLTKTSIAQWAVGWVQYLWMMRASIMAGLVPSLTAAATSVWGFTAALLANPITWAVAGVAAFAGAAYLVYRNWEPISAYFKNLWGQVTYLFSEAWTMLRPYLFWTPLGQIIENWEPISAFFSDLWVGVVKTFEWAWEKIRPVVDGVSSLFGGGAKMEASVGAPDWSRRLGVDGAAPLFGAASAVPNMSVAPQPTETRVRVDFANLPSGARVRSEPGGTAPLDLNMGYGMLTP